MREKTPKKPNLKCKTLNISLKRKEINLSIRKHSLTLTVRWASLRISGAEWNPHLKGTGKHVKDSNPQIKVVKYLTALTSS